MPITSIVIINKWHTTKESLLKYLSSCLFYLLHCGVPSLYSTHFRRCVKTLLKQCCPNTSRSFILCSHGWATFLACSIQSYIQCLIRIFAKLSFKYSSVTFRLFFHSLLKSFQKSNIGLRYFFKCHYLKIFKIKYTL